MNERINPKVVVDDTTIRKVDTSAPAIFVRFSAQVGPNSQMELSFGIPLDMTTADLNSYVDKVASVANRQNKKSLLVQAVLELDNTKKQLVNNTQNRANYELKQATDWVVRNKKGDWVPSGQERAQIATFETNDRALRSDRIPIIEKQIAELKAEINKDA
jgi:hypothetical protein